MSASTVATTCPTWCTSTPAEHLQQWPVDRRHFSESPSIVDELELMPGGFYPVDGGTEYEGPDLRAYLDQGVREAAPLVRVAINAKTVLELTVQEADLFAQALAELVRVAG